MESQRVRPAGRRSMHTHGITLKYVHCCHSLLSNQTTGPYEQVKKIGTCLKVLY